MNNQFWKKYNNTFEVLNEFHEKLIKENLNDAIKAKNEEIKNNKYYYFIESIYYVKVCYKLPGYKAENIKVKLIDELKLNIVANSTDKRIGPDVDYTIDLNGFVDKNAVINSVTFEDGILTVEFDRPKPAKQKQKEYNVGYSKKEKQLLTEEN